jgi:RNA polymerase sigma factor (sigma-70 family)
MVSEGEEFPRGVPPHARSADPSRPSTPRLPGRPDAAGSPSDALVPPHTHASPEAPAPDAAAPGAAAPGAAAPGAAAPGSAAAAWVPPSWDEIVRDHSARVYRLAYRLTGNAHDAEDLTQDVFIRVFRSLDSYSPGTFEGWLHRITTNLFRDRMRRKARIRFDALPEDAERVVGPERSPEALYADRHLEADVEAALNSLPADFRVAVVLCDIEQLSYEEIADVLHVKLGTVRSRISRGRTMLRRSLSTRSPGLSPGGAPT